MIPLKRILIVEDDPQDIELTLAALEDHNLANEITVTRDGVEALNYLNRRGFYANRPEGNPILILLDIKMPRLNGIELLKQIKYNPETRTIPVVVLTSSRESKDLETCYKLGVNAYVVKPIKFADFLEAVKEIGVFWALINEPPL